MKIGVICAGDKEVEPYLPMIEKCFEKNCKEASIIAMNITIELIKEL